MRPDPSSRAPHEFCEFGDPTCFSPVIADVRHPHLGRLNACQWHAEMADGRGMEVKVRA